VMLCGSRRKHQTRSDLICCLHTQRWHQIMHHVPVVRCESSLEASRCLLLQAQRLQFVLRRKPAGEAEQVSRVSAWRTEVVERQVEELHATVARSQ